MVIDNYFIGGYSRLNYHKLSMAIDGYWWLFYWWILAVINDYYISGYSINDYW
jgi:hypothetical protein